MRRKIALGVVSLIAGSTMVVGAPAPAYACHDIMYSENPIHNWMCATVHEVAGDDPVGHYYDRLGETVKWAYCTLWEDPLCP